MANCTGVLAGDIINDCTKKPIGGLESTIYLFNRSELTGVTISPTNKNLMTAIDVITTKKGFKYEGFKKTANAGFDLVVADNLPDAYTQILSLIVWGIDSATVLQLNNLNDIVAVVENKNKGVSGDGAFEVYGYETGLYKTSFTKRSNDNGGTFSLEMGTQSGEESSVSHHILHSTNYAATKAMLDALLITQA